MSNRNTDALGNYTETCTVHTATGTTTGTYSSLSGTITTVEGDVLTGWTNHTDGSVTV